MKDDYEGGMAKGMRMAMANEGVHGGKHGRAGGLVGSCHIGTGASFVLVLV